MIGPVLMVAAGVLLAAFGVTFVRMAKRRIRESVEAFGSAYVALGLALIAIGAAAWFGNQSGLEAAVIISYALIALGTVFMLRVAFFDRKGHSALAMLVGVVGGVCWWIWIAMQYPPHPAVADGTIQFNTATPVLMSLALVFGIWLFASAKVGQVVAKQVETLGWLVTVAYAAVPLVVLFVFGSAASWPLLAALIGAVIAMIFMNQRVVLPEKEAAAK